MSVVRRDKAYKVRKAAARMARYRPHPNHISNGNEYSMTFTKGLEHDPTTLLVMRRRDVVTLRDAIDAGYVDEFNAIARPPDTRERPKPLRKWEAPTVGFVYDLQGPDAQAVTMQPAPRLGSVELIYEMAEVYELALLRDVNLSALATGPNTHPKVEHALARLNAYGKPGVDFGVRPRTLDSNGQLTKQNLFRGSSPGVDVGPYVSQFLLMGSETLQGSRPEDGYIKYGAQQIDQRVPVAAENDYMMDEHSYLEVQNGVDVRDDSVLFQESAKRFIQTPRDLATYVHDDALYQAYLNACLILLSHEAPFDPHFDKLSGMGAFGTANTGGFALWGGPHILSLVTEVATRALKAVRFQKFNVHLWLRPEALAARVHKFDGFPDTGNFLELKRCLAAMRARFAEPPHDDIPSLEAAIQEHTNGTMLLPMAFQEGSPMHPSYGAGHASVAGACVTILKAFFDTSAVLLARPASESAPERVLFDHPKNGDKPVQFEVNSTTGELNRKSADPPLTLEGELNKLAANISIGRNMAGVHYFSDYYDSLRMGEEVAIGILEEQALTYPKDPFIVSLDTFDGGARKLPDMG